MGSSFMSDQRLPEISIRESSGVIDVQHCIRKKICYSWICFQEGYRGYQRTPAIYVCHGLLGDKVHLAIYDPQVTEDQIRRDLATSKFDHPQHLVSAAVTEKTNLSVIKDPYEAAKGAHGVCILMEWNEFMSLDYQKIYDAMEKPVFFFDGRNVVNVQAMRKIGFIVYSVGKPLDDWIKDLPAAT
ncbi:hypothetical protein NE237_003552 [Protea cynaroides]|uniref:UDP-glucose/GDP-mannose dehydrogenase C-terminal domain-containing protein n=1 Tax=Protea cynaroides TaxID=273540 RepID=A0A9Q0QSQ2_9MAGN|nr:hypothetical protein NE237_003552 [Protea cynaroides]